MGTRFVITSLFHVLSAPLDLDARCNHCFIMLSRFETTTSLPLEQNLQLNNRHLLPCDHRNVPLPTRRPYTAVAARYTIIHLQSSSHNCAGPQYTTHRPAPPRGSARNSPGAIAEAHDTGAHSASLARAGVSPNRDYATTESIGRASTAQSCMRYMTCVSIPSLI